MWTVRPDRANRFEKPSMGYVRTRAISGTLGGSCPTRRGGTPTSSPVTDPPVTGDEVRHKGSNAAPARVPDGGYVRRCRPRL